MTYTPGPWVVIDIRDIGKELLEICTLKEGEPVCVARIDHRNNKLEIDKEDEANANLIASAPEMLEALTLVKTMIDNHAKHCRNGSGYQKICDAMKKARGEE